MADGTKIEWTDATWNPITGCSVVSPGCTNCYAMRLAGTRMRHHPSRQGLTAPSKAGPVWTGAVRFNDQWLAEPLKWKKPRRIFVCAHGDLFHEGVTDEQIDRVFAVMAVCRHHTFQVLTKRSDRMLAYLSHPSRGHLIDVALHRVLADYTLLAWRLPLPNVWLGVSVEDQQRADERIPVLLDTPAAVRWLSCEPLLGGVDLAFLRRRDVGDNIDCLDCLQGAAFETFGQARQRRQSIPKVDWVVAGGESGPSARPMHPDWVRSLREQCAGAGVPFLFKQWGNWRPVFDRDVHDPDWRDCDQVSRHYHGRGRWLNLAGGHGFHGDRVVHVERVDKAVAGRLLDGQLHDGFPA